MIDFKKKELEIKLQNLRSHPEPKPELEQYMTPGGIAARLLHLAYSYGSIEGKGVYDLGCGTGRLSIGAAILGADRVIGIDVDKRALEVARKNAESVGVDVGWILADVRHFEGPELNTVVMNPPFGVQRRGADMEFLEKALELSSEVYSIHKSVPRNRGFISERVKEVDAKITNRIEEEFHISAQFEFHTRDVYRFKVDIYRIVRR